MLTREGFHRARLWLDAGGYVRLYVAGQIIDALSIDSEIDQGIAHTRVIDVSTKEGPAILALADINAMSFRLAEPEIADPINTDIPVIGGRLGVHFLNEGSLINVRTDAAELRPAIAAARDLLPGLKDKPAAEFLRGTLDKAEWLLNSLKTAGIEQS